MSRRNDNPMINNLDPRPLFPPLVKEVGIVVLIIALACAIATPLVLMFFDGQARERDWQQAQDIATAMTSSGGDVALDSQAPTADSNSNPFADIMDPFNMMDPFGMFDSMGQLLGENAADNVVVVARSAGALPQGLTGNCVSSNGVQHDNVYVELTTIDRSVLDDIFGKAQLASGANGGENGWDWYAVIVNSSTRSYRIVSGNSDDTLAVIASSPEGLTNIEQAFAKKS